MIETDVPKFPKLVADSELVDILSGSKGNKIPVSYRLTPEAIRIIDETAELYGVDKTKAIELALRVFREENLRKKK